MHELGIEYDSSIVTVQNEQLPATPFVYKYNGTIIKEFPVPAIRILGKKFNFSSSGYFRIAPFGWIKHKMDNEKYMISYFHPRDFDSEMHRYIPNNMYLKMRYRLGVKSCMSKLVKLTHEFDFINIKEAADKIDWERVPVVKF